MRSENFTNKIAQKNKKQFYSILMGRLCQISQILLALCLIYSFKFTYRNRKQLSQLKSLQENNTRTVVIGLSVPGYRLSFLKALLPRILANQNPFNILMFSFDLTAIGLTDAMDHFCRISGFSGNFTFMWVS